MRVTALHLPWLFLAYAQLNVVPLPTHFTFEPGCLLLPPSFSLRPDGPGGGDALLAAALLRTQRTLSSLAVRGESVASPCSPGASLAEVEVRVGAARAAGAYPALGDDESYTLALAASGGTLNASTVWGALRGLETLTQLISADRPSDAPGGAHLVLPAASVRVEDSPRFPHRGLMIDTGRAFLPLPVILAALDAMAYVKMNALHWHLVDDQAFPAVSSAWPNLTAGAMQAPSMSHTYSKADVAAVVEAATARGIRVIPEFDVPGHTASWFKGCAPRLRFGAPRVIAHP